MQGSNDNHRDENDALLARAMQLFGRKDSGNRSPHLALSIAAITFILSVAILGGINISSDNNYTSTKNITINNKAPTNWSEVSNGEKDHLTAYILVSFPEIYGTSSHKYKRVKSWLADNQNMRHDNIRDIFTAGGRAKLTVDGKTYNDVPRVLITLSEHWLRARTIEGIIPRKQWEEEALGNLKPQDRNVFLAIVRQ